MKKKILQGYRLIFRDGRFVFMMKNNNVGKLRRNLKIFILASWSKCSRMPLWKSQRIMMVMVQVLVLKSKPIWYRDWDRTSNLNHNTIYNWHRNRDRTHTSNNIANNHQSVTTTIICLGTKPTTGTGTQPTTPTGPIPTAPTTTTPTTTTPVPESAAVTDNRNAQVVKATQANQAFGSAFMSGFAPVLQQPTKQQSA